ncbi:hypothetical protein Hanom_Chr17g01561081 [Helianthus anomalus]
MCRCKISGILQIRRLIWRPSSQESCACRASKVLKIIPMCCSLAYNIIYVVATTSSFAELLPLGFYSISLSTKTNESKLMKPISKMPFLGPYNKC